MAPESHWPPKHDDPKDVVTIVVTSKPDSHDKQSFWIKWHDANLHGWRAQHFRAKLDYYRQYNWDGRRVVIVEELS